MFVIVYRNDAKVIGGWGSAKDAEDWLKMFPNALFTTAEEWEHAEANADYFITEMERLVTEPPRWPVSFEDACDVVASLHSQLNDAYDQINMLEKGHL